MFFWFFLSGATGIVLMVIAMALIGAGYGWVILAVPFAIWAIIRAIKSRVKLGN